ncbi:unnamed protein product [Closterium sp. NIES-64]|nr:unnamed protein product [Closterium sp. NIES-64]
MAERQQERASPSQPQQQQSQPGAPMATDAQTEARAASVEAVQAAQEAEEASKRAYVKQAQAQEKMQVAAQVAAQQQQAARQAASMAASEAARAVREDERAAGRQQQQESAVQGMIAQQAAQMAVQQQQQQPQQPMQAAVQQQQGMVTGPSTAPLPGASGSYYSPAPGAAMSGVEGAAPLLAAAMQGEHAGAAAQAFVAQMASEAAETAAQSMAAAQHMAASAPNDAAVQQKAQEKKAKRHIYSTGAAGCGGKAAPTNAKNTGQPLPCPFCERVFKQDGRLKDHIKSQHADAAAVNADVDTPNGAPTTGVAGAQSVGRGAGAAGAGANARGGDGAGRGNGAAVGGVDGEKGGAGAGAAGGGGGGGRVLCEDAQGAAERVVPEEQAPHAQVQTRARLPTSPSSRIPPTPRLSQHSPFPPFPLSPTPISSHFFLPSTPLRPYPAYTSRPHPFPLLCAQVEAPGGGFHARAIIPDPRDPTQDTIVWWRGTPPAPSSLDAHNRAATMALHRVMGSTRMDRVLGEEYRQQWRDLDREAEDRKERDRRHAEDRQRREERERAQQQRQVQRANVFLSDDKRQLVHALLSTAPAPAPASSLPAPFVPATTAAAPQGGVDLSGAHAATAGIASVPLHAAPPVSAAPASGSESESSRQAVANQLLASGFPLEWTQQATAHCSDYVAARDWLILHMPEHLLPAQFAASTSASAVAVLHSASPAAIPSATALQIDQWQPGISPQLRWLLACGYDGPSALQALSLTAHAGADDEVAALQCLQQRFPMDVRGAQGMGGGDGAEGGEGDAEGTEWGEGEQRGEGEVGEAREEERMVLEAIFGPDLAVREVQSGAGGLAVVMSVRIKQEAGGAHGDGEDSTPTHAAALHLEVIIPATSSYPFSLPLLAFRLSSSNPIPVPPALPLSLRFWAACALHYARHNLPPGMGVGGLGAAEAVVGGDAGEQAARGHDADAEGPACGGVQSASAGSTAAVVGGGGQWRHWQRQEHPVSRCAPVALSPTIIPSNPSRAVAPSICITLAPASPNPPPAPSHHQVPQYILEGASEVPQYILEGALEESAAAPASSSHPAPCCSVVITQPRRISAVGLAHRVAQERAETVGDTVDTPFLTHPKNPLTHSPSMPACRLGYQVGYAIRMEARRSQRTRLLFCTTGLLLRRLLADPLLAGVSHVVVDEVHERSLDSDLLLLLLRFALLQRNLAQQQGPGQENLPLLRIVLMSATADAHAFADYFHRLLLSHSHHFPPSLLSPHPTSLTPSTPLSSLLTSRLPRPALITVPGRTHPVRQLFLEDALALTNTVIGRNSKYARKGAGKSNAVAGGMARGESAGREGGGAVEMGANGGGAGEKVGDAEEGKVAGEEDDEEEEGGWESLADDAGDVISNSSSSGRSSGAALSASSAPMAEHGMGVAGGNGTGGQGAVTAAATGGAVAGGRAGAVAGGGGAGGGGQYSEAVLRSLAVVEESVINYELIEALIAAIRQLEGSRVLQQAVEGAGQRGGRGAMVVVTLHGSLAQKEQQRVFAAVAEGTWKVVLSTNVAETSHAHMRAYTLLPHITATVQFPSPHPLPTQPLNFPCSIRIPCVALFLHPSPPLSAVSRWVVDSGRKREVVHDVVRGMDVMGDAWVSQAAASQRAGRAGRVQPGCCIRLYSRSLFHSLPPHTPPEMLRVSLHSLCLQVIRSSGSGARVLEVGFWRFWRSGS